jgi:hypothetical protein
MDYDTQELRAIDAIATTMVGEEPEFAADLVSAIYNWMVDRLGEDVAAEVMYLTVKGQ